MNKIQEIDTAIEYTLNKTEKKDTLHGGNYLKEELS